MSSAVDELLVQGHALPAERTLGGVVRRKVTAHEAEDGLAVDLDRGPPPQTAHPDDLGAELLDELDEEVQRAAAGDQVLHEQHPGAGTDEPLELDRQAHPPLAPRQALGPVD